MSLIKTKLTPLHIEKECPACSGGRLIYNDSLNPDKRVNLPPEYPHQCGNCGCVVFLSTPYPRTIVTSNPDYITDEEIEVSFIHPLQ